MKGKLAYCSLAATMLGVASPAMAASPWDYASISLVLVGDIESGGQSEDLEGHRVDVAKSLGNVAFFRTAFNGYQFDAGGGIDADASTQQFGIGGRLPLATRGTPLELWGSVNYERVSFAGGVGTGPGIDLGIRARMSRDLELGFMAKIHGDIDFGTTDADYTGYELSLGYMFQPGLSLLATFGSYELEFSGSQVEWDGVISVGARFGF